MTEQCGGGSLKRLVDHLGRWNNAPTVDSIKNQNPIQYEELLHDFSASIKHKESDWTSDFLSFKPAIRHDFILQNHSIPQKPFVDESDWTREFERISMQQKQSLESLGFENQQRPVFHRYPPLEAVVTETPEILEDVIKDKVSNNELLLPVENREDDVRQSALGLLAKLDLKDPKFRNSKFVKLVSELAEGTRVISGSDIIEATKDQTKSSSFLNEHFNEPLARNQEGWLSSLSKHTSVPSSIDGSSMATAPDKYYDFPQWTEDYLKNISHLIDPEEKAAWDAIDKGWKNYYATGFGYTGFAIKNFGFYPLGRAESLKKDTSSPPLPLPWEEAVQRILQWEQESRFQEIIKVSKDLLNANSISIDKRSFLWLKLCDAHLGLEDESLAIASLHSLLDETGWTDSEALYRISVLYANSKCIPEMGQAIQRWINGNFSFKSLLPKMNFRNRSMPSTMSSLLAKLIHAETSAKDIKIASLQAIIYDAFDMQDEAINTLKQATADIETITSDNWGVFNRLAAMLIHKGNFMEAIDLLERLIQVFPFQMRLRFNLSIAYSQLGSWNEALEQVTFILRQKTSNGGVIETISDETWKLYQTILDLSSALPLPTEIPDILDEASLSKILQ